MRLFALLTYCIFSAVAFSQTLVIGSSSYNPPFETWTNNNEAFGYDIEFMTEICKRMQMRCKFQPFTFNTLFPTLEMHKVDLVISAIVITDARKQQFLFSLPYLTSGAQYITAADSTIKTIQDVDGTTVCSRKGTPYGQLAYSLNQNIKMVYYNTVQDMLVAIKNNNVDACIMDYEAAKYWISTNSNLYKLIGEKIPVGDGYGIMANLNQTQLIDEINRVIIQMQTDGTFLKIYSHYF